MNDWQLDEYGCWVLRQGEAWVWITKRPSYCDRGHFLADVGGIQSIDGADSFPRYYMDLERAKLEMAEWLAWRLRSEANREAEHGAAVRACSRRKMK